MHSRGCIAFEGFSTELSKLSWVLPLPSMKLSLLVSTEALSLPNTEISRGGTQPPKLFPFRVSGMTEYVTQRAQEELREMPRERLRERPRKWTSERPKRNALK